MLAIKAYGDMGQTARLRIIRDCFIAGHSSCELRRHLDSVSPEMPIRDIVNRCRVWESHADLDVRQTSKPGPDPTYPTYAVSGSDGGMDDLRVAAVTTPQSAPDQLETLFWRLLASTAAPAPAPKPEPPTVGQLLQHLLPEAQSRQPAPAAVTGTSGLETLQQNLLSGSLTSALRSRPGSMRRDWTSVVCFSCGKVGHSTTRCPALDAYFPFMLPGWKAEKEGGGYVMISPRRGGGMEGMEGGGDGDGDGRGDPEMMCSDVALRFG